MQSVLLTAAILDVGIQFVGWALASVFKTEKFYDLFGSGTFALIAITSLLSKGTPGLKQFLLAVLILIWALRLGSFLVVRVLKTGGDKRFDGVKSNPGKFAVYWFLQAVWVYVTMLPTLFVMNATLTSKVLAWSDYIGLSLFLLGFGLESMSDLQKYKFKMDPENTGKFINSGIWSYSRHPNYFGEMLLWWGLYVICVPTLRGPQHLACLSPIFLTYLLCFVSGIPILERSAEKKWGSQKAYKEYKSKVPVLIPFFHTRGLEHTKKSDVADGDFSSDPEEGIEDVSDGQTLEEPLTSTR